MSLAFRCVTCAPLDNFDATAPDGTVVSIIGDNGSGKSRLLRVAAGMDQPESGGVKASGDVKYLGPDDPLILVPAPVILINQTFARQDLVVREKAAVAIDRIRRAGGTILVATHDEALVHRVCDEVWWIHRGRLAERGDPRQVLALYRKHVAEELRAWGETVTAPLAPKVRRGDGRAEIVRVETVGESGKPTMVWRSGERAVVKVAPCSAGTTIELAFAFWCELCPQEYTVTVASHDPDGIWHDWLEDAVAFSVSDVRHTAGVANLRTQVSLLGKS